MAEAATDKAECQVFEFRLPQSEPREIKKGRSFSDFSKEFSLGENHDSILEDARRWLGEKLEEAGEDLTLSMLRLKKGLSQEQLGKIVGTQQPNVARFEKGAGSPGLDMIRKWCAALDIDFNTFEKAHSVSGARRGKE